jgi:hypothetical protein
MWLVVENVDGCLVVEVSGEETVDDFRSCLAAEHGLPEGFVLACKGEALCPSDFRKLNSIPIIVDMAVLSVQSVGRGGTAADPAGRPPARDRRHPLRADPEFRCEITPEQLSKPHPRSHSPRRPDKRHAPLAPEKPPPAAQEQQLPAAKEEFVVSPPRQQAKLKSRAADGVCGCSVV